MILHFWSGEAVNQILYSFCSNSNMKQKTSPIERVYRVGFRFSALGHQGPFLETNYFSLLVQRRPDRPMLLHFSFQRGLINQFFILGPEKA